MNKLIVTGTGVVRLNPFCACYKVPHWNVILKVFTIRPLSEKEIRFAGDKISTKNMHNALFGVP